MPSTTIADCNNSDCSFGRTTTDGPSMLCDIIFYYLCNISQTRDRSFIRGKCRKINQSELKISVFPKQQKIFNFLADGQSDTVIIRNRPMNFIVLGLKEPLFVLGTMNDGKL